jgi:hypothetical protein
MSYKALVRPHEQAFSLVKETHTAIQPGGWNMATSIVYPFNEEVKIQDRKWTRLTSRGNLKVF